MVALRSRAEERLQQFWSSLGAANWGERSRRSLFLGSPELMGFFLVVSCDSVFLVALRSRAEERLQQFWSSLGAANWGERSRRSLFLGSPALVDHEERRKAAERR